MAKKKIKKKKTDRKPTDKVNRNYRADDMFMAFIKAAAVKSGRTITDILTSGGKKEANDILFPPKPFVIQQGVLRKGTEPKVKYFENVVPKSVDVEEPNDPSIDYSKDTDYGKDVDYDTIPDSRDFDEEKKQLENQKIREEMGYDMECVQCGAVNAMAVHATSGKYDCMVCGEKTQHKAVGCG